MSAMNNFLDAVKNGNGFDFLSNYETYSTLTHDEIREIARELFYALESLDNSIEIENAFDEIESNLRDEETHQNTMKDIIEHQKEREAWDKFNGEE
jgi:hypothetical protein